MATTKKIDLAKRHRLTDEALLEDWERKFRTDFARDGGARFKPLLERFCICTDAQEMLEGTVDFVTACAILKSMDGVELSGFLADQRYDSEASTATYALTFDLSGRGSAGLLVRHVMKSIDMADLFEYTWEHLCMAGYGNFWVSRIDGADLSVQKIEKLNQVVSADIWFDYSEDDVSIIFDLDSYAGPLSITVCDQILEIPDDQMPST